jgi:hypothetical protein
MAWLVTFRQTLRLLSMATAETLRQAAPLLLRIPPGRPIVDKCPTPLPRPLPVLRPVKSMFQRCTFPSSCHRGRTCRRPSTRKTNPLRHSSVPRVRSRLSRKVRSRRSPGGPRAPTFRIAMHHPTGRRSRPWPATLLVALHRHPRRQRCRSFRPPPRHPTLRAHPRENRGGMCFASTGRRTRGLTASVGAAVPRSTA